MLKIFGFLAAAVVVGCTTQSIRMNDYVQRGERTRVPADIPVFKITALDGYESEKHPSNLLVAMPTGRMMATAVNGGNTQWVAMMPTIEPIYRMAALEVLKQRGRTVCTLGAALPLPENMSIEFPFTCEKPATTVR